LQCCYTSKKKEDKNSDWWIRVGIKALEPKKNIAGKDRKVGRRSYKPSHLQFIFNHLSTKKKKKCIVARWTT